MAQSIAANDPTINSHVPHQNDVVKRFRFLTKRQEKMLKILDENHSLGHEWSDYGVRHFMNMFRRGRTQISLDLSELRNRQFIRYEHGGSANAKLGITCEGIEYLVNQTEQQTEQQSTPYSYIDLPEQDHDQSKIIIPSEVSMETEEEEPEPDLDFVFDKFLERKKLPYQQRLDLRHRINRSKIGPARRESLIRRLLSADKKNQIQHVSGYVNTCLQAEEKQISDLLKVFRGKPGLVVDFYAN